MLFYFLGTVGKLGDNLMHLSIGITANISKVGWKRATSQSARYEEDDWSRHHRALVASSLEEPAENLHGSKSGYSGLNTAEQTEPSLILNLDELASLARGYRLHITIIGAAGSATGTADINNTLGKARANFIANALKERGVPSSQITKRDQDGTNEYSPAEANRQTKVILHYN